MKAKRDETFIELCECALHIGDGKLKGVMELLPMFERMVEECGSLGLTAELGFVTMCKDEEIETFNLQALRI